MVLSSVDNNQNGRRSVISLYLREVMYTMHFLSISGSALFLFLIALLLRGIICIGPPKLQASCLYSSPLVTPETPETRQTANMW